ncbi:MAG TPA: DUF2690 domain-containing protein [Trebonia sp.]|nr:DUF2690 domain-containing protein [Trebonia sp.]
MMLKTISRISALVLVAAGLPLGAMVATTGTAEALSCYAGGCYAGDPVVYGCASDGVGDGWGTGSQPGKPDTSVSGDVGTIELEWSPGCQAKWAKVINSKPGMYLWVENANGDVQEYQVNSGYTYAWTNMVSGYNQKAQACVYNPGYEVYCTAWF